MNVNLQNLPFSVQYKKKTYYLYIVLLKCFFLEPRHFTEWKYPRPFIILIQWHVFSVGGEVL